ncbi:hypothetical protein BDV98DRAFT_577187 [Pterulicium gracile]|uniref:Uncharacterized protein n=1 Tax=Pterulicium gracile TaxID=1884261 RepID=A0A5C3Q5Z4_9AGAR|nr:hypothetical protein BDV98DRAFT_577187 [Pterula gracilis]
MRRITSSGREALGLTRSFQTLLRINWRRVRCSLAGAIVASTLGLVFDDASFDIHAFSSGRSR